MARIEKAATFNQGFATVEYLASALVDMKLHLAGARPIDPDAFEKETLAALGMPEQIVMRHRTPQFGHIFSGDGYSAGYYSYLWADTLSADAYEAFTEAAGPYDRAVASACARTCSPPATPSIPPTATAPSAAATPASTPSCASAASHRPPARAPSRAPGRALPAARRRREEPQQQPESEQLQRRQPQARRRRRVSRRPPRR